MSGRIIVFGATGYTGELVARALVKRGHRPVLAARSPERTAALAAELGGLWTATADVTKPETVSALVERGDVLISTVGPFVKWGDAAVEAAVAAGATYLDSTGEPAFIRRVFDHYGPSAAESGSTLVPSVGFDWVPGNLAGALALESAGPEAVAVNIGYFTHGGGPSGGTAASTVGAMLDPSFAYRGGRLRTERTGARVKAVQHRGGDTRMGISVGGTEHFELPAHYPSLQDVEVMLGRGGASARAVPLATGALSLVSSLPGVGAWMRAQLEGRTAGSTGGPDSATRERSTCTVVAEARSASGQLLHRTTLVGPNPYDFTAGILAWAASVAAEQGIARTGAMGPITAFGLGSLTAGAAEAGLTSDPV